MRNVVIISLVAFGTFIAGLLFFWWKLFKPLVVVVILIIEMTIHSTIYNLTRERPNEDFKAVSQVMNFVGAEKVLERDRYYEHESISPSIKIFNDTLVNYHQFHSEFYIQSLTKPTSYKPIKTDKKDVPSYLYGKNLTYVMKEHIQYFKNGCIYFANDRKQIDKLCLDGTHKSLLKQEAMAQKNGRTDRYQRYLFKYHKGLLVQETDSGVFVFEEKSGECLQAFPYSSESKDGGAKIINNVLVVKQKFGNDTLRLTGFNLGDFQKLWDQPFNDAPSVNWTDNFKDVLVINQMKADSAYFINTKTGKAIARTRHKVYQPHSSKQSQTSFDKYSNYFGTVYDSTALVKPRSDTSRFQVGKWNFRTEDMVWKAPSKLLFPYQDYVVTIEMSDEKQRPTSKSNKRKKPEKLFILAKKSGEVLKEVPVNGWLPEFAFRDRYIQAGDRIYR